MSSLVGKIFGAAEVVPPPPPCTPTGRQWFGYSFLSAGECVVAASTNCQRYCPERQSTGGARSKVWAQRLGSKRGRSGPQQTSATVSEGTGLARSLASSTGAKPRSTERRSASASSIDQ